jgi:hypothetical protein
MSDQPIGMRPAALDQSTSEKRLGSQDVIN